jgi:DNA-binding NarL/FixJ family response regulator
MRGLRDGLTQRQFEIAVGVMRGLSNKGIGRELGISHFTVRNHLSRILLLLGLSSRQELGDYLRVRLFQPT